MLYYRLPTTWHNQDVAVLEKEGVQYTARIVAQPGDVVEITEDEGIMDELKKLGDRLDPSADLTELRTELDGIIHRITGDNAA